MAQSALGFGLFSFAIDYMGNKAAPPAAAAVLSSSSPSSSPCVYTASSCRQQRQVICNTYTYCNMHLLLLLIAELLLV